MDLKRLKLAKECFCIVNQLYDLAEVPTEKRQAINDEANKYLFNQILRLDVVTRWLAITEELPKHGETVLTYTPTTEMAEEQIRLIKYGILKSGFPAGITHWKYLDKPTCA